MTTDECELLTPHRKEADAAAPPSLDRIFVRMHLDEVIAAAYNAWIPQVGPLFTKVDELSGSLANRNECFVHIVARSSRRM